MRCPRCAAPVAVHGIHIDIVEPCVRIDCWCEAGNRAGTHDPLMAVYLIDARSVDDGVELPMLTVAAPIYTWPPATEPTRSEPLESDPPRGTPPGAAAGTPPRAGQTRTKRSHHQAGRCFFAWRSRSGGPR
jgi:hypothetical protein